MDLTTIGGLVAGIALILLGQAIEGGHASSLVQLAAAIIVFGGTLGATAVGTPMADLKKATALLGEAFRERGHDLEPLIAQLVDFATVARRDGVLALEGRLAEVSDPFLRRGLALIVDGVDAAVVRDALEGQIHAEYEEGNAGAKAFESAGGYAPTIGILGAVLGLIHVMENLSDPSKLGPGIATAFVATVYGVGLANLVLLPIAGKLKRKLGIERDRKTLVLEGLLALQEGLNPRVLEEKLRATAALESAAAEAA